MVFLLFAKRYGDKYGNKLVDNATKTGLDAGRTASKSYLQRTAEYTGYLIGNNIADETTSIGTSKEKPKDIEEMYIPAAKRKEIIDDLKLF